MPTMAWHTAVIRAKSLEAVAAEPHHSMVASLQRPATAWRIDMCCRMSRCCASIPFSPLRLVRGAGADRLFSVEICLA